MASGKKRRIDPFRLMIVLMVGAALCVGVTRAIINVINRNKEDQEETGIISADPIYPNHYDWDYLNHNDGLYTYEDDNYTSRVGVDVSYAQGEINWNQLKQRGIEFAMIRVGYRGNTEGALHEDDYYQRNMQGAQNAGIDTGVYFASQAVNESEAKEEAEFVLERIKNWNITCPVAFDMENSTGHDRISSLTQQQMTQFARIFIDTIKQAGYQTLVYGSSDWLRHMYAMSQLQDETSFWMAAYNESHPSFPYQFDMWQYSSSFYLSGISGPVDMDLWIQKKSYSKRII